MFETFNVPATYVAVQAVIPELKEWLDGAWSCVYASKAQASTRVDVPTAPMWDSFSCLSVTRKSPECETKARPATSRTTHTRCSWWFTVGFFTRTLCATVHAGIPCKFSRSQSARIPRLGGLAKRGQQSAEGALPFHHPDRASSQLVIRMNRTGTIILINILPHIRPWRGAFSNKAFGLLSFSLQLSYLRTLLIELRFGGPDLTFLSLKLLHELEFMPFRCVESSFNLRKSLRTLSPGVRTFGSRAKRPCTSARTASQHSRLFSSPTTSTLDVSGGGTSTGGCFAFLGGLHVGGMVN